MIGGIWRWVWAGSVFGVFALVVAAALDGAPGPDGVLPVIVAGSVPIKERRDLPPIDTVVPPSSVLNVLVAPDAPNDAAGSAQAGLERGLQADLDREREVAALETALQVISPGEPATSPQRRPVEVASLGVYRIQIAAVRPGQEHDTFDRLQNRFRPILGDLSPRFQAFSADGGVLVRVQAGPIEGQEAAAARCRRLQDAGGECFVVQAPG